MFQRLHYCSLIFFLALCFYSPVAYSQCLSLSVTTAPTSCYGSNDGEIALTINPGTPPDAQAPYDIELFFRDSDGNLTQLAAYNDVSFTSITFTPGNGSLNIPGAEAFGIPANNSTDPGSDYKIDVRSTGGTLVCRNKTTFIAVGEPAEVVIDNIISQDITCAGGSDGQIIVDAVSGGVGGPYDYSIDAGATFQASNTFSALPMGTYGVVARDGTGCESAATTVTLSAATAVTIDAVNSQNISCNGGNDGEIVVTTTSGGDGGPYEYSIDDGVTFQASNTFSGLTADTYAVRARDASGCVSAATPVILTEPVDAVDGSTTKTDVACFGESTGSIAVTGTGGTSPYDFSIDGGATYDAVAVSDHTYSNLPANTYNLVVRDANGCVSAPIPVTISEPSAAVTGSTLHTDVACFGESTGSITITGNGGVGPYDFSDNGGATYTITDIPDHTFNGLAAGDYDLRVRDVNGCESPVVSVTIDEPATAVSGTPTKVDVLCAGESTGSITLTGSGGTGLYDFSIDGGATYTATDVADYTFAGLDAGTYNLTVRDANNCVSSPIVVEILEPADAVSGNTTHTDVLCFGENTGSIDITGSGGVGPYDFSIDGGGSYGVLDVASHTFSNLPAGTYNLTVRDANACVSSVIVVIIAEPASAVGGSTSQINVLCFGESTGSISIVGSGGVTPYDFSIDGGATYAALDLPDHDFINLPSGSYTLKVRDANGCVSPDIVVNLTQPGSAVDGSTVKADVACNGEATGSINITGSGGTAPYDFSIDAGATYDVLDQADHDFLNLLSGTYTLVVRDANACVSAPISVTLAQPSSALGANTTVTDAACFGETSGSIEVTPTGGTGPFDFSIDGGSTYAPLGAASHTFTGLAAGSYPLRVRDANSCETAVITAVVGQPADVTNTTTSVGAVTVCAGSTLPDVVFTFTGTAPFDFTYSDGTTPVTITDHPGTTFTISGATPGTYSVTALSDNNGCAASDLGTSITVTEEPAATADAGTPQSLCSGQTLTLSGASVGGSAASGAWSITSQPTGGDGILSDENQTATPSSVTFSATVAGTYTLRLTTDDPAGVCGPATDDVVITVSAVATADAGPAQTICVGGTATMAATFTGATGVNWTTSGDGSFDNATAPNAVYTPGATDQSTGSVTLTVTTTGPCAPVNDNVIITIDDAPTVDAGTPTTICSSAAVVLNASFGGSATGLAWTTSGDGEFSDSADPNASYTPGLNDAAAGSVTLTATATGSCPGTSDNVVITVNPAATVSAGVDQSMCTGTQLTLDGTIGGAATAITWTTSGDGGFNNIADPDAVYTPGSNDTSSGTVTLTATTNNPPGPCPAVSDQVVVTITPAPGDQTTAGNESWIGYVYDDDGDLSAITTRINFANAKYRGFIEENDIANMSAASSYDAVTDEFDLNLGLAIPVNGPNVCSDLLEHFSIRYKMDKTFSEGVYRFTVGADDGVRLLIDGVNVLPASAFDFQSYTTYTTDPVCLSAGVHNFEIHYFDNAAYSRLTFEYEAVPAVVTNDPIQVCINSPPPVLTASSSDADVTGFNWYKEGTLVFTGANYTPSSAELDMTTAGAADFNVTAVYACGETPPVTVNVTVLNAATLVINDQTLCESGGVVDLSTFITPTPAGGTFVFSGHSAISGNNFDPSGLAGNVIPITVDYSTGSCTAPQGTLTLTITSVASTTVPSSPVDVCEGSPDVDLTTLVSAVPSGGSFTFSGPQVAGNMFDPSGLSGSQTITVDYSSGGCASPQTSFVVNVTTTSSVSTTNANACQNGSSVNLLTLVSANPAGGVFTFSGPGVTGDLFNPAAQSGTVNIDVDYDFNGCTDNGIIQITVLSSADPLCTSGNCSSVVIVPQPEPATCTNSDGRLVMSIEPFTPTINNTGVKITIEGVSSTNLTISRTIFNNNIFEALPVGKYTYEIEYGDPSCIKTGSFSIDQSGTVGTPVVSDVSNPLCYGTAAGSLTLDLPGETGNVLEWSLDAGLSDPFKPFVAGSKIEGLAAGPAPSYEHVISVRRDVSDVCYSSVTVVMNESVTVVSATFNTTAATCNGNDGAITDISPGGGNGAPYSFSIDGGQSFQSENSFNGLAGGSYTLRVRDAAGCESDFTANVTFPGFINSAISKSNADCTNDGNSGSIAVTVTDPGVFQVALSTDQFNTPSDAEYVNYTNPLITFDQLGRGEYFVYVRSESGVCPTRSAPIQIFGVYDVSFSLQPDCNNNELSLALVNVTGQAGGAPLEIQVSKKFSSDPPEIIYEQFPADGVIYLDHDQYAFLRTPGEYSVQIIQFQGEVVCNLPSEIVDFIVPVPLNAGIGAVDESYPDVPSGKMSVVAFSGGVHPYDVRIELDSASSYALPYHATDFERAGVNANQQIEMSYGSIPAGRYQVQVMDSLGCVIDLVARVPLDEDLYIPNVFTPNGDGSNDVFFIRNLPQEPAVNELVISNRWGKKIFTSENYQNNWDGMGAADGIYFYRLMVSEKETLTGWVELIRGPKP